MTNQQGLLGSPEQDEQEHDYEEELARRLFGDTVQERPIVNTELGIYPMDDD